MKLSDLNNVLSSKTYAMKRVSAEATQSLDMQDIDAICDFLQIDPVDLLMRARRARDLERLGQPPIGTGE